MYLQIKNLFSNVFALPISTFLYTHMIENYALIQAYPWIETILYHIQIFSWRFKSHLKEIAPLVTDQYTSFMA